MARGLVWDKFHLHS